MLILGTLYIYRIFFFGVRTPQFKLHPRIFIGNCSETCTYVYEYIFFWVLVPPARLFATLGVSPGVAENRHFD